MAKGKGGVAKLAGRGAPTVHVLRSGGRAAAGRGNGTEKRHTNKRIRQAGDKVTRAGE